MLYQLVKSYWWHKNLCKSYYNSMSYCSSFYINQLHQVLEIILFTQLGFVWLLFSVLHYACFQLVICSLAECLFFQLLCCTYYRSIGLIIEMNYSITIINIFMHFSIMDGIMFGWDICSLADQWVKCERETEMLYLCWLIKSMIKWISLNCGMF